MIIAPHTKPTTVKTPVTAVVSFKNLESKFVIQMCYMFNDKRTDDFEGDDVFDAV